MSTPASTDDNGVKPGYKTTEGWLSLLALILSVLVAMKWVPVTVSTTVQADAVKAIPLISGLYAIARGIAKAFHSSTPATTVVNSTPDHTGRLDELKDIIQDVLVKVDVLKNLMGATSGYDATVSTGSLPAAPGLSTPLPADPSPTVAPTPEASPAPEETVSEPVDPDLAPDVPPL